MTRNTIQDCLDDVWLCAEIGETRRCRSAKIVHAPRFQLDGGSCVFANRFRYPFVERRLGIRPTLKGTVGGAENVVPIVATCDCAQDRRSGLRKRDLMRQTVPCAVLSNRPERGVEVEFRPEHLADFL